MDLKTTNLQALPENGILQKFDMLDKNSQLRCGKSYYQNPYSGSHLDLGVFKNFVYFTLVLKCVC